MSEHEHDWQANGTVEIDRTEFSPVSTLDDILYTEIAAVQSCSCGAVKRTKVGHRNMRTRGGREVRL